MLYPSQLHLQYTLLDSGQQQQLMFCPQTGTYQGQGVTVHCQLTAEQCKVVLVASEAVVLGKCSLTLPFQLLSTDRLLCNGFQSWTSTHEHRPDDTMLAIHPLLATIAAKMGDYNLFKYKQKNGILHAWTYALRRSRAATEQQPVCLLASVDERSGYTLVVFDNRQQSACFKKHLKGRHLAANEHFVGLDVLALSGSETHVWQSYQQSIAQHTPMPSQAPPPIAGWTSWYQHYTSVSQAIVLDNLRQFAEHRLPINLVQIDDGWQAAIGDWTSVSSRFKDGMHHLAQQIHQKGYQAGLWIAPFICQKQSAIYRQHPEWLLRDADGDPISAGYNVMWRSAIYVLDFYQAPVQAYLQMVLHTLVHLWEFDLLKIDFLYAVALQPPPHKTHGEVMYDVMHWLRQQTKGKLLLGCGVPLGSAFGQLDYCRIGADVHLDWEMSALQKLKSRERISTVNALQNTLFRRQLDGLFWGNDPDVSILRRKKHYLNAQQQFTLFFWNQLLGSVQLVSDEVGKYDAATMQRYRSQFPLLTHKRVDGVRTLAGRPLYHLSCSIGKLHYEVFSNLSGYTEPLCIGEQLTNSQQLFFFDTQKKRFYHRSHWIELHAYQTVCLLVVDHQAPISVAGSVGGHLFAGCEVQSLQQTDTNKVQMECLPNMPYVPRILLCVNAANIDQVWVDGRCLEVQTHRLNDEFGLRWVAVG